MNEGGRSGPAANIGAYETFPVSGGRLGSVFAIAPSTAYLSLRVGCTGHIDDSPFKSHTVECPPQFPKIHTYNHGSLLWQVAHRRTAIPEEGDHNLTSLKPGRALSEYLVLYRHYRVQMHQFKSAHALVEKAEEMTRATRDMSLELKVRKQYNPRIL